MKNSVDKARFYDLIIDRAKKELDACGSPTCDTASLIFRLIPELNIDKDEMIRNEIIQFLQLPHPQFVGKRDHEEWIAWLKKQGKQTSTKKNAPFEKKSVWKPSNAQMLVLNDLILSGRLPNGNEKILRDLQQDLMHIKEGLFTACKTKLRYDIGDIIIPLNDEMCEVVGIFMPFADRATYKLKRMSSICGAIFDADAHAIDSTATWVQRV